MILEYVVSKYHIVVCTTTKRFDLWSYFYISHLPVFQVDPKMIFFTPQQTSVSAIKKNKENNINI